jgi:pantetheine-phosphate adenylyltransferase
MTLAVFPGSFDPITNGHLDIIKRASKLYDEIHILVADNIAKNTWFTAYERMELITKTLEHDISNFVVSYTSGLVVDYCSDNNIDVIIRSLRNTGDYLNEITMALINRKLSGLETVFLIADQNEQHISSSAVRELVSHHKDVSALVPRVVSDALERRNEK